MSFASQLTACIEVAKENIDKATRAAVVLAAQGVVQRSPVDTGRLRGSWVFGLNAPAASGAEIDKSGNDTVKRIKTAVSRQKAGSVFYVTTNLPYARVLEYGLYPNPPKYRNASRGSRAFSALGTSVAGDSLGKTAGGFSRQAPVGMVRTTFADLPTAVRQYVAGEPK